VFTLPAPIGDIACQNKAEIYDILFKASAETLTTIAADPKHLGARVGITSVLHTWGSALTHHVNSGLKIGENHRFEIPVFFARLGSILLFDPRREHSSVPTAKWHSRCAEGLSRLAASSRPPAGLGLDWPEHSGTLDRIRAGGAHHVIGNFKPVVLDEIHAAADKCPS
jgi:hypothetical protein